MLQAPSQLLLQTVAAQALLDSESDVLSVLWERSSGLVTPGKSAFPSSPLPFRVTRGPPASPQALCRRTNSFLCPHPEFSLPQPEYFVGWKRPGPCAKQAQA